MCQQYYRTVLLPESVAVNLALLALMMAPRVENRRSTVADDACMQIQLLIEMDISAITSIQKMVVCRSQ